MRKTKLIMIALGASILAGIGARPAVAYDYPWCAQGTGYGYPGECAYQTYEQCLASVSGRRLYCDVNPAVAFRQAPPRVVRHGRRVHPY